MKITKSHNPNNLQKNNSTKVKIQNLPKENLQVEASSQNALEQMGRAQLGINFKGIQEEIPEPLTLEAKLKIIANLNLTEENNANFLLTLTDKIFLKFTQLIATSSLDECVHLWVNRKLDRNVYNILKEFFETGKLPAVSSRFPKYYGLESSETLLDETKEKTFNDLRKRGLTKKEALILAHFNFDSDIQKDRAAELAKRGVYAYGTQIHCRSKESYDKKIKEIESKKNKYWEYNKDYNVDNDRLLSTLCRFQKIGIDSKYALGFAMDKKEFFEFVDSNGDTIAEKNLLFNYLRQGNLTYEEARKKASIDAFNAFINLGKSYDIEEETMIDMYNHIVENPFNLYGEQSLRTFEILKNGADLSYAMLMEKHHFTSSSGYEHKPYKEEFEKLIKNGINPKVAQIIATTGITDPEKIKLIEKLVDKKFISEVKKKVNNPNLDKHLENIFNIRKFDNPKYAKNLLESNLSYEEIVDGAVKLMKSPIKYALRSPQQYLSGIPIEHTIKVNKKYPPLDKETEKEYKEKIETLFKSTLPYALRAIKYLDNDTFNQLMDKRSANFSEELKKLDELNNKSYELLSKLLSIKTKNGKPLPSRDKIELAKIILQLQNAKMLDEFNFINEEGFLISNQELHNKLQDKIFKIIGLNEEEISQIPSEKLNFDKENMYSLLTITASGSFPEFEREVVIYAKEHPEDAQQALKHLEELLDNEEALQHEGGTKKQCETLIKLFKNLDTLTDKEIFKLYTIIFQEQQTENRAIDVVRIALFEDFGKYIQDESNEFGQTNAKTKEKFRLSGINYNSWMNYDTIQTISLNDHDFKIQMWDRNPQKDLFMGNRTSCCTGIGEVNGKSTPTYLANTAFNVIQLKDEKNNIVAMSRIFLGNVDSEPSLILDNIEVNNAFLKDLNDEKKVELRNEIFKYAKNFTNSLTEKEMPIYFSTSYTKLPVDDLKKKSIRIDFIGECTNSFYSNVKKGWIKAENLKEEEYEVFPL